MLAAVSVCEGEEDLSRAGSCCGDGVGRVGLWGLGTRRRKRRENFLSDYESGVDRSGECFTSLHQAAGRALFFREGAEGLVAVDPRAERGVGSIPNVGHCPPCPRRMSNEHRVIRASSWVR